MLQLPNRDFAAFIFDCDGTLVDSMPLHYVAWVESLRHHNATFEFTEDIFYSYAGVREQDTVAALNLKHGTNVDPDSVAEMKATIFHTRIPEVKTVPPVVQV
ncbi:MAG: haloacid dehalogenase, partial [Verrucomicrobiaceae bacterium]|nr:haloacid dehalogenase [Verrucomicrobiaceae bacterium]